MLDDAVHVLNGAHERKKVDPQEVDAPAEHYARLFWFTLAFGIGDAALFAVATAYLSYAALNVDLLLMGPCLSVFMLYTFGTLDSAVHGPRAIGLWAALWLVQTVIMVVSYAVRGEAWAQIAFWAFFFLLSATAFGWLMHMLREELRARHRGARLAVARALTERLVKVVGLQIGLLVVGVVQGVAKETTRASTRPHCSRCRC